MGIIRKLYDKGEGAINSVKKKFENPLKDFEKEINNLKSFLKDSKSVAAQLNALKIRATKDIEDYTEKVAEHQSNAEDAIKRAYKKLISEEVAKTISINALKFKKSYKNRIEEIESKLPKYDDELQIVKDKISDLILKIEFYEKEYNFLKNKAKDNKNPLKDIFSSDDSIFEKLEKLKDAILKQNEKTDAYEKNADVMYGNIQQNDVDDEYNELKKKMKK